MTKRHYIAVAQVLASELAGAACPVAVERVALALADLYKSENDRFDRARFLAACGVEVQA